MSELSLAESTIERLEPFIGVEEDPSPWFDVTQENVTAFADLTHDHNFIHVDPERSARETQFGGTIAHGFYSLSLLSYFFDQMPVPENSPFHDAVTMVNYGMDKLRFASPVAVCSRIRAKRKMSSARPKGPEWVQITYDVTVEIENEPKPAIATQWHVLMICGQPSELAICLLSVSGLIIVANHTSTA